MKIRDFFKLFLIIDIIVIVLCVFTNHLVWLINIQIAFLSSLIVTYTTFLSYKKNVLANIDNQTEFIEDDENTTSKKNYLINLKKSFFSFASLYRVGGYVVLIVGFFYLNNNAMLNIYSYLFGFLIVPISILGKVLKNRK
jgi:Ca2+/Na+ antiporter